MLPKSNADRARGHGGPGRVTRAAGAARNWTQDWTRVRGSALRRRIILFNLIALTVLALGAIYLGGSHDALLRHRADTLLQSATHMSQVMAERLPDDTVPDRPDGGFSGTATAADILQHLRLRADTEVWLFDPANRLLAHRTGDATAEPSHPSPEATPMVDGLSWMAEAVTSLVRDRATPRTQPDPEEMARVLAGDAVTGGPQLHEMRSPPDQRLWAAAPVVRGSAPVAVLVLSEAPGVLDALVREGQERALRIFLIAALISVGLSLVLARAISGPLEDLAQAAETGRDRIPDDRGPDTGRIRIPDLTGHSDEIGRLSESLRGMVAALYQRIESNEQFAADVAHEIKNPLTSLRCAVDTMRMTTREDQRECLLEVIEHDVRRLDRLVSDMSRASRLDSDLVREEQVRFDLVEMLRNMSQSLKPQTDEKGVALITDFPDQPLVITGIEARLAQVFVNLITNAISFCKAGDTIRVWARRRGDRVLVVVEDSGPGLTEGTLERVFERFYSNRPADEFGNHSGLGLAISKQIVEAHDGVIWAENIQPADAGARSGATGARFVVGLSV
ncbi:MAG: ATP-binding protein [Pseudomonadota bacterium]